MSESENELFKLINTNIEGCYKLKVQSHHDNRGFFIKTFHAETFKKYGLADSFKEVFYSYSYKNVLRGLHFQVPPHDHDKLVYCISGKIFDVVLDIRKNSKTYGKFYISELNANEGDMLYISSGMAHGFYALTDSIMVYQVTSLHASKSDCGILWNSANIPWPNMYPILSERDKTFMKFEEFISPFTE